ncbi:MAG: energy transducer TonB, partial [Acidobacteriota bacterium]
AEEGRGEAEYVALEDEGSKAAKKFYERVRTPLLTDISIDWNNLPVADVYPNKISDLFSAKPVILHGRYTKAASGTIRLKGKVNGQELVREIPVDLPEAESANDSLATLWARTRIDDLTKKDYQNDKPEVQQTITNLGLEYNLLTQFTSFVAVEEKIVNYQGKPKKIEVPAELPQGLSPTSKFTLSSDPHGFIMAATIGRRNGRGIGQGSGSGSGSGNGGARAVNQFANVVNLSLSAPPAKTISGGVINGKATNLVKPTYPVAARATGLINVQIKIDESGNVISASAISGHPLLRLAAEQAARKSTFAPTMLSGKAVKVTGVIVYNFTNPQDAGNINISVGELRVDEKNTEQSTVTPEMQAELERLERERLIEIAEKEKEAKYRQVLAEKFHFWIYDLAARLQKGETESTPNEAKFVKDGKAEVQVQLTAKTPETIEKLKNLGFEIVDNKDAKIIFGRIAVDKLANLAEIVEVQYVLPLVK